VERDGHPADLWQIQRLAKKFEALWVADGLLVVFALELGIERTAGKEVLIGPTRFLSACCKT